MPSRFDPNNVHGLRIKKVCNQYFAIFTMERKPPSLKSKERIIALDPNHKNLAYGVSSGGEAIEILNPWFLKRLDRRIDVLKAKRDRCNKKSVMVPKGDGSLFWRPSRRWIYLNNLVEKTYLLRREQTKVYLYTVTNKLYKKYDVVSVGDYTPTDGGINKRMRRAMNNQSLIGRWKEILSWVAQRSGKTYFEWSEKGSTRTCSNCYHVVTEGINPCCRQWKCPNCGKSHIRDENAAKHGLMRTYEKLELPCSGHREISSRCAWWFSGLGILEISGVSDR